VREGVSVMKTTNPLPAWRVAKALKPRNPVLAALKANQGARGGPHQKTHGAVRRAEKMALVKQLVTDD
jgi:hypothetical protein